MGVKRTTRNIEGLSLAATCTKVAVVWWIWCPPSDLEVTGSIPTLGASAIDTKYWF
ncbi:hypothetical protein DPMN_030991 [Dreissena polymorpha]|uniref:Uncharacterized protein n=1 Tax=Dreissena polymorpha TaxID=45954 RepID=A0A9D4RGW5_DREPO|nr:hypothetical protein DPMN_030991 [Dreissena polymorpha]